MDFGNRSYDPSAYAGDEPKNGDGTDPECNVGGTKCDPSFSVVKSGTFYATGYTEDLVNLALDESTGAQIITPAFNSNVATEVLVPVNIRDDGKGNLMLVTKRDETELILNPTVGTVDYGSGKVCVGPLAISDTPDNIERLPIQVVPYSGSIDIPPGVDPTIFNPAVNPIDFTINTIPVPTFDPNNFSGYNFGPTGGINIIDYPMDSFEYPVPDGCF